MKINLNWLAEYVDLQVSDEELIERINTQLGEIEDIEDLALKYDQALIVKVVTTSRHPQADRLTVCLIDDQGKLRDQIVRNDAGLIQVICGANNVKAGMLAVWLPPGAIIPSSFNTQPVVLESKEIRGQLSYGMLASQYELDLGVDQEGILELPADQAVRIGQSFGETYNLDTKIINIENKMFTHRPDCFGLLGVAREIAGITNSPFRQPKWYYETHPAETAVEADKLLKIDIQSPQHCPRLRARLINNLTVSPSPLEMQFKLASIGLRPINNIVDLTNYTMYVSGQPTHAFDYDKLVALSKSVRPLSLVVRQSQVGETLTLINGKTTTFNEPAVVIATDCQPVALAGIMGGIDTEVDEQTINILLEVANFNQYALHRSSMHYGIFSDALTRFTKGQSPLQIGVVSNYLATSLSQLTQGQLVETIYEVSCVNPNSSQSIVTSSQFINDRLGSKLTPQIIASLLEKVEFTVTVVDDQLTIEHPFWRTDINIAEDIVEEIGRLNGGYMSLEPVLPTKNIQPAIENEFLNLKHKIRHSLASRGANEVLSYSFISKKLASSSNQNLDLAFNIANPLNPNLEVYRQDLSSSIVPLVITNEQFGFKDFALFEIGCVHQKAVTLDNDGLPPDLSRLALIYCPHNLSLTDSFYVVRRYLDLLAQSLKVNFEYEVYSQSHNALSGIYDLDKTASIRLNNQVIGVLGLIVGHKLAGCELDLDLLHKNIPDNVETYTALSRFPKSSQDLTLQVDSRVNYSQLQSVIEAAISHWQQQGAWQINMQLLTIFKADDKDQVKNISFRIEVNHLERTTNKEEVSSLLEVIVTACADKLQAKQV